jgi:RNA polymerase sigma factor (sigma-70 family)
MCWSRSRWDRASRQRPANPGALRQHYQDVAAARRRGCADADLVTAAREGDKDAFAVLVSRHRPVALALVRKFLQRRDLADDAVQEASVVALVGLDRLRSPERFGAWYAGIALNVSRRWLREIPAGLLPAGDGPDAGLGPAEQAEAAELARRVHQAVQALAPGQREAVLAFYWQGLTHAEAAAELGINPNAVKARLHQARAALAPRLAPYLQPERKVHSMASASASAWVDMNVIEVRRSNGDDPTRRTHAVVLADREGSRHLPIYIGPAEAVWTPPTFVDSGRAADGWTVEGSRQRVCVNARLWSRCAMRSPCPGTTTAWVRQSLPCNTKGERRHQDVWVRCSPRRSRSTSRRGS